MEISDVAVHPAKCQVILGDGSNHNSGSQQPEIVSPTARLALVLHSPPMSRTIWPREFVEVHLPSELPHPTVDTP